MFIVEAPRQRICHPRAFREESGGQQRREPAGSSFHFLAGFLPFNH
jgi:hypothetical protein